MGIEQKESDVGGLAGWVTEAEWLPQESRQCRKAGAGRRAWRPEVVMREMLQKEESELVFET